LLAGFEPALFRDFFRAMIPGWSSFALQQRQFGLIGLI
jgi:hypothetical protein